MNTGSLDPLFGGVDGGGVLLPEGNHLPLHLFDLQHVELEEGEGDGSSVADSEDWTKVTLWFSPGACSGICPGGGLIFFFLCGWRETA